MTHRWITMVLIGLLAGGVRAPAAGPGGKEQPKSRSAAERAGETAWSTFESSTGAAGNVADAVTQEAATKGGTKKLLRELGHTKNINQVSRDVANGFNKTLESGRLGQARKALSQTPKGGATLGSKAGGAVVGHLGDISQAAGAAMEGDAVGVAQSGANIAGSAASTAGGGAAGAKLGAGIGFALGGPPGALVGGALGGIGGGIAGQILYDNTGRRVVDTVAENVSDSLTTAAEETERKERRERVDKIREEREKEAAQKKDEKAPEPVIQYPEPIGPELPPEPVVPPPEQPPKQPPEPPPEEPPEEPPAPPEEPPHPPEQPPQLPKPPEEPPPDDVEPPPEEKGDDTPPGDTDPPSRGEDSPTGEVERPPDDSEPGDDEWYQDDETGASEGNDGPDLGGLIDDSVGRQAGIAGDLAGGLGDGTLSDPMPPDDIAGRTGVSRGKVDKLLDGTYDPRNDGPADDDGGGGFDVAAATGLLDDSRNQGAGVGGRGKPGSGDDGGYVIEQGSVGGDVAGDKSRARTAHGQRAGDHAGRDEASTGTGDVPDPLGRLADSVNQVSDTVRGASDTVRDAQDIHDQIKNRGKPPSNNGGPGGQGGPGKSQQPGAGMPPGTQVAQGPTGGGVPGGGGTAGGGAGKPPSTGGQGGGGDGGDTVTVTDTGTAGAGGSSGASGSGSGGFADTAQDQVIDGSSQIGNRKVTGVKVTLNYEAYSIPDQFQIRYEDKPIGDTGNISGNGTLVRSASGSSPIVVIRVLTPQGGTSWNWSATVEYSVQ